MSRNRSISLAHGSGGKAMRDLIDEVFVKAFDNERLSELEDQARIPLAELAGHGSQLAFTTDSFVVDPLFFPGGDIGTLAINGTVNDLSVSGATPLFLSCAVIIEEGLELALLERVTISMRDAALKARIKVVTGDTKVVPRGNVDKLFVNTAGIGVIPEGVDIRAGRAKPGDRIITSGYLGDHGAAVLNARGDLALESTIESDCQPLHDLVAAMLNCCSDIHCLRDATRGGIATVLNEFAETSGSCFRLREEDIPIREEVRGFCEILGLDPLYLANEGTLVAVVPGKSAEAILETMRRVPAGKDAAIVGEVTEDMAASVIMDTPFGGERMVDMHSGEQLPRIC